MFKITNLQFHKENTKHALWQSRLPENKQTKKPPHTKNTTSKCTFA